MLRGERRRLVLSRDVVRRVALPLTIAVALLGGSFFMEVRARQLGDQVPASLSVHTGLVDLLGLMQDAETGQRGYLLTGRDAYLEPYETAVERAGTVRERLDSLEVLAPFLAPGLQKLEPLIEAKLGELAETIRLFRSGDPEASLEIVTSDQGRTTMVEARGLVGDMLAENQAALAQRTAEHERATLLAAVAAWVALLVLALAAWVAVRQVALAAQSASEAKARADQEAGRLDLALKASGAGVFAWHVKENVNRWDHRTQVLHGLDAGTFDGTYEAWASTVHPDDLEAAEATVARALETKTGYTEHYRIRAGNGGWRTLRAITDVQVGADGSPELLTGICQDVTEEREAARQLLEHAEALKAANRELERSNEELERFAWVASHDLQEPLRMVAIFTERLAAYYGDDLEEEPARYIQFASEGAKRGKQLINDLLQFSSLDMRDQEQRQVDTARIVSGVLDGLRSAMDETGAKVTVGVLPTLWAYPALLSQAFLNLIGNALKFRRPGVRPEIAITAERLDGAWEFAVQDNGIGIPADEQSRIFQIFSRLHPASEYPGTGLGLALVEKVVHFHSGTVRVESTPGEGSRFIFTLPDA